MSLRRYFGYMQEIVYRGSYIECVDFEPIKRLEYWRDVKMFGSANNGTCKSIFNIWVGNMKRKLFTRTIEITMSRGPAKKSAETQQFKQK